LIAGLLAIGFATFFGLGLDELVSFQTLAAERERLLGWVAAHPLLAPMLLSLIYALTVTFSLPIATVLTPAFGFLLGTAEAAAVVVVGATMGSTILFLLARSAFGERWRGMTQRWLSRFDRGFEEHAFQYLLVLRLIPIIPFFVLNIVPAFTNISLRSYMAATAIGIIPGTVVYSSVGAGLGAIFDRGEVPSLAIFNDPAVLLPLAGLSLLAALPIAYRKWRERHGGGAKRSATPLPPA
jgi:uncharacterized membrane protein YdjX (TVP38/TMEM64 family)